MNTGARRATYAILWMFALAFGWIEASVAVYLRELSLQSAPLAVTVDPTALPVTLVVFPPHLLPGEMVREACTLVLLATVGWCAGRRPADRTGAFLLSFGIWDVAYYGVLRLLLGWPANLSTWDVLFLIPVPWVAPVWAPMSVAIFFVLAGSYLFWTPHFERRYGWGDAGVLVTSIVLTLAAFLAETKAGINHEVPAHFPIWLFWSGVLLGIGWFTKIERQALRS